MLRRDPLRTYYATVVVVAVLSIAVGMLVANLTGQYVGVFFAQLLIAGLLGAWYVRIRKRDGKQVTHR